MWLCGDSATSRFFLVPGWALPGGCCPAWLAAGWAWPWLAGADLVGWSWSWLAAHAAHTHILPSAAAEAEALLDKNQPPKQEFRDCVIRWEWMGQNDGNEIRVRMGMRGRSNEIGNGGECSQKCENVFCVKINNQKKSNLLFYLYYSNINIFLYCFDRSIRSNVMILELFIEDIEGNSTATDRANCARARSTDVANAREIKAS